MGCALERLQVHTIVQTVCATRLVHVFVVCLRVGVDWVRVCAVCAFGARHAWFRWKLGEHGDWSKCTNWELDARVPLIIRAPWLAGDQESSSSATAARGSTTAAEQQQPTVPTSTGALAELVDIFPTAVELAGLPPVPQSEGLNGSSLVAVLKDPQVGWLVGWLVGRLVCCHVQC